MSHPHQSTSNSSSTKPHLILKPHDLDPFLDSPNPVRSSSAHRKHLIKKLSSPVTELSTLERHLPSISIGILKNQSLWLSLLQSAALDQDVEDLVEILDAVKRFDHDQLLILGRALSLTKKLKDSDQTTTVRNSLLDAAEKIGLSPSSALHQVEVHRLLYLSSTNRIAAFQAADSYLRRLEKAGKPASPEVYLQLFDCMNYVSMKRMTSIDLFNRLRLLAHPHPPISIWNALLRALASGASTQPERAMDAFLDLKANGLAPTVDTYNHLIRSMIRARRSAVGTSQRRSGYEKWYYSALRLLKQMIDDDGVRPNLSTFLVLLEGAKRIGDLARAKWTYGLFVQQLEYERQNPMANLQDMDWLHVSAVVSLLQTYASFSPSNKYLQVKKKKMAVEAVTQCPLNDPKFYKTLPESTLEILTEVEFIFAQFISSSGTHQRPIQVRNRADKRRLSVLISSYLSVYSSHSTIEELYSKYTTLTHPINQPSHQSGAIRISWTYLILLERCEFLRSAQKAGSIGREIFKEWESNQESIKQSELVRCVESRLMSQIWAAWIRLQAKYGSTEEAMKELERFYRLYPPSQSPAIKDHSRKNGRRKHEEEDDHEDLDRQDSTEGDLSNSLTPFAGEEDNLSRPYLTFQHLEILHHRLKNIEDLKSIRRLKVIVKNYESARRKTHDLNELKRINRIQKGYKD